MSVDYNTVELTEALHEEEPLVADNCSESYVKHIVASFILTTGILICVAYLAPHPFGTVTSKINLPVFAGSGHYYIKVSIHNLSSYVEHLYINARFLNNKETSNYVTGGNITISGTDKHRKMDPINVTLHPTSFTYVNGKSDDDGWAEITSLTSPACQSIDLQVLFNEPTLSEVMEIRTVYTRSSAVCFSIWVRSAFLIFHVILFIYTFETTPSKMWTPAYLAFLCLTSCIITSDIPGLFHFQTPEKWLSILSWLFGHLRRSICFGFGIYSIWQWNNKLGFHISIITSMVSLLPVLITLYQSVSHFPASSGIGIVTENSNFTEKATSIILILIIIISSIISISRSSSSRRGRAIVYSILTITTLMPNLLLAITNIIISGSPLRTLAEIGGEGFFTLLLYFLSSEMPTPSEYLYRKAGIGDKNGLSLVGEEVEPGASIGADAENDAAKLSSSANPL